MFLQDSAEPVIVGLAIPLEQSPVYEGNSPKRRLDTPDIILPPVPPRHLLLAYRHPGPHHPHQSDLIPLILVKLNLQPRIMPFNPLRQPPLLHYQSWFFQLNKLAADIAAKELEFTADVGAFEEFGGCACKGGKALGGGEGGVELGGCGAELFSVIHGCGIDG